MEFNEKLILLRRENHLTQAQLAANLGVTRQTVYKWETGQSYPEAMTLFAMKNLFRVSIDCLLDNTASLPETRELISASRAKENPEEAPKKAEIVESKEEAQEEYYKRVEQAKKDRRYVDETTGKIYETDDYFELYNDAEHWYYEVYLTTEYFYPKRT